MHRDMSEAHVGNDVTPRRHSAARDGCVVIECAVYEAENVTVAGDVLTYDCCANGKNVSGV